VRPRWLHRNAYLVYGVSILLLLLVPLVGEERNNAKRWIELPWVRPAALRARQGGPW
jgi:cell division protein FtsW (lipid II flippase)